MSRQPEIFSLIKRQKSPYYSFKLEGWKNYVSCQSYYLQHRGDFDKALDTSKKSDALITVQHALSVEPKKTGKYPRGIKLRDLMENAYDWDRCPHVTRLREEGDPITERHASDSRWVVTTFILPDQLMEKPFEKIKRADILDFRSRLMRKVGPRTVNKALTILRTMIREHILREIIDRDPTIGIKHVADKERKDIGIFSAEELRLLFPGDGIGPWRSLNAYTVFFLAMGTGMRRGEIMPLKWNKINFKTGLLLIDEAFKDANFTKIGKPKWDKIRLTPVPGKVLEKLEELKERGWHTTPNDFVFCKPDGTHYGQQWWSRNFKISLKNIGISNDKRLERNLKPHSFRHTLNTILLTNGHGSGAIRAALGWSSEKVQEGYTHYPTEFLKLQSQTVDTMLIEDDKEALNGTD